MRTLQHNTPTSIHPPALDQLGVLSLPNGPAGSMLIAAKPQADGQVRLHYRVRRVADGR